MKKYIEITLDERVWKLRYDFQALSDIEEKLGQKIQKIDFKEASAKTIVILLWAGLLWDAEVSIAQVGHMIDGTNIEYVRDKIDEAFKICFPTGKEKKIQSKTGTGENSET